MSYRYQPADYMQMMLGEDMQDFYSAMTAYKADKSENNMYELERTRINLFFSIKHRILEGNLTRSEAQEMQNYFGGLYND